MRPLRLKFEAFASFVKATEIDFRPFAHKLFLISGDTGAGKTTIFDAISYALYGEASGGQRSQRNLRSDFAEPSQKTQVELSFEHGGSTYRILRNPAYSRPKVRGEGITQVPSAVELYLPDGRILSKKSEVDEQIYHILGQNLEEFRQTSMLAQGEFSKFLQANSDEKAKIFRELFNTRKIVAFQEKLKAEVKRQSDQLEYLRRTERELIQQITLSDEELESAKQPFVDVESAGYKDLSPFWEIYQSSQNADKEKLAELRLALEEQVKQQKAWEKKHAEAETWLKQKEQWTELNAKFLLAQKQLANRAEREKELETEKKILSLVDPPAKTYQLWLKAVQDSAAALKLHLDTYELPLKQTATQLAAQEQEVEASNEQAEQQKYDLLKLEESLAQYDLLDNMQRESKGSKEKFTALQGEVKKLEDKEASLEEKLQILKDQAQFLAQAIKNTAAAREEARKSAENRDAARELQAQYHEYCAELDNLKQCLLARQVSEESFQKLAQDYQDLEQKYLAMEIFRLSQKLKDGQPCPVCGSLHHPSPAEQASLELITEAELELARKNQDLAGKALREEESKQQEASAKVAEKAKSLLSLARKMHFQLSISEDSGQPISEISPDSLLQKLSTNFREAQVKLVQAEGAQSQAERAAAEADSTEGLLRELRQSLKEKQKQSSQAASSLNALEQQLAVFQAKLQYADKQSAERVYQDLSQQLKDRAERMDALRQDKEAFQEEEKKFRDKKLNLQARLESHEEALEAAGKALSEVLAQCDLCDLKAYLELGLSEDLLQNKEAKLREDIENLRQAEANESAFRKTWDKKAQHQPLEDLSENISSIREQISENMSAEKGIDYRYKRNSELAEDLQELRVKLTEAEAYYDQSKEVSDVANGNLRGGIKTDFENYIQAYYFKQIIESANLRLIEMSGGRYLLKYKENPEDRRKVSGLDLDIQDNFSGKDRPVSTLSGGESFLASLALALGLSDIAGWQNRNISVETLFIDEGFGSLDRESLRKAIDILQAISKNNYLCGIISHVDILKEKIPYRIDVKKGNSGSSLEIVGV